MLIGHAGIAQFCKFVRRDIPLGWLLVAAFLPDLIRAPLALIVSPYWREVLSHSLPSVILLALAIGVVSLARHGDLLTSAILCSACLTHWPADALTGCKPLYDNIWVGRFGYRHPVTDIAIEGGLLIASWWLLRRQGAASPMVRRVIVPIACVIAQATFLASMYVNSEFFVGKSEWLWYPHSSWIPRERPVEQLGCHPPAS